MWKAERVALRVSELLGAAVRDVLELVRDAVAETQRENQRLRGTVRELQERLERDSAAALVTTSIPPTFPGPEEHPTLRCNEQLNTKNTITDVKPGLKEEPSTEAQTDIHPTEIKTETEQLIYSTTAEESTPQNSFFTHSSWSCTDPNFHLSQNELPPELPTASEVDFPLAAPCGNAEVLNTFTEPFTYEENEVNPGLVENCWRRRSCQQNREEGYSCQVCGKTFSRLWNLRIHNRCHTGEKPYICLHCGRRFTYSGNLQKHKRVHTGERPYRCLQCNKTFCQSSHLKKHQMIHLSRRTSSTRRNMEL